MDHSSSSSNITGTITGSATGSVPSSTYKSPPVSSDQRYYSCDKEKLEILQKEKPWMKNPKHFASVAVSPSAIMKMMMHCANGVQKGIAKGGNPIEVMGLLLGRPDPLHPTTLIVTDAFPLPIEGFETRVIADDQAVVNHMIALNESLETSRNEKFMGWYHSHPFDLGDHSHCFLSQTDLSTQLQWQRAEDPHGNPFVAMVLDPLRSTHLGLPQIKAFRAFPPEYQSPIALECPDGTIEPSEKVRLEHWGSCWNRYYELNVEYYMSTTSRKVLQALTQNYLWISNLKQSTVDTVQQLELAAAAAETTTMAAITTTTTVTTTTAATATSAHSPTITTKTRNYVPVRDSSTMMMDLEPISSMTNKESWESQLVDTLTRVATHELAQTTTMEMQKQVFQTATK